MQEYVVKYNLDIRRVVDIIEKDAAKEYERIWENADQRLTEVSGPVKSVSLWFTHLLFVLVEAEDTEMAQKLALDWIDP